MYRKRRCSSRSLFIHSSRLGIDGTCRNLSDTKNIASSSNGTFRRPHNHRFYIRWFQAQISASKFCSTMHERGCEIRTFYYE
uniref:Uncharacterized protein n=1 Tax=Brassica campestris TaxID=3711 RepID=A0A3P5YXL9_BRACM|nr:unnamed protein product [Brassica rapa]